MSLMKRCDMCSKLFNYDSKRLNSIKVGTRSKDNSRFEMDEIYDICPDCIQKFVTIAGREEVLNQPNNYWNNVCKMQAKQRAKGIETYGQTLEENTELTPIQRLEYLEEELIDGLMYIEHIKAGIR